MSKCLGAEIIEDKDKKGFIDRLNMHIRDIGKKGNRVEVQYNKVQSTVGYVYSAVILEYLDES